MECREGSVHAERNVRGRSGIRIERPAETLRVSSVLFETRSPNSSGSTGGLRDLRLPKLQGDLSRESTVTRVVMASVLI